MLSLRDLQIQDKALLVEYLNTPEVVQYLSSRIPQPYTLEDAHWWVTTGCKENSITRAVEFDGQFCGVIGAYLQPYEYTHSLEIGYWFAKHVWGKGVATQAVKYFTDFLFTQPSIERVFSPVFCQNRGSMRVLEKSGYELEGVFKKAIFKDGCYYDEHRFAIVK